MFFYVSAKTKTNPELVYIQDGAKGNAKDAKARQRAVLMNQFLSNLIHLNIYIYIYV